MKTTDFTEISARYERDSLIQKSAADRLISLLDIRSDDDVLDLGCGTGSLTRKIRMLTDGRVVGVDPSAGMIREAEENRGGLNVLFAVKSAEQLDYKEVFSAVFCNSAIQWFHDHKRALKNCHQALRIGGRMGIQAPAKKAYCPNFLAAIDAVAKDSRTAKAFTGFKPPWLFLDAAEEYAVMFKQVGFTVPFAKIETVSTLHSPDEVMTIFESGAAAGYLNQEYYSTKIGEDYARAFREVVKGSFHNQANAQGKVKLAFNRIYLLAVKERQ
jgi:trans-aconitate methyltransferase